MREDRQPASQPEVLWSLDVELPQEREPAQTVGMIGIELKWLCTDLPKHVVESSDSPEAHARQKQQCAKCCDDPDAHRGGRRRVERTEQHPDAHRSLDRVAAAAAGAGASQATGGIHSFSMIGK